MISTITPIIRNVCLIVSLLSVSALWAEPVKVGDFYYELAAEGKTATLTPSTEYTKMTQVNIPGSIDVDGTAYTVTAIGANAFKSAKLTHLTIGEGVTTVSDNAFYMCRALSEVQFPSTLTGVGKSAFYYCTSIKALVLPDKLTDIGQKAFSYLSSMEELTLPANMTEIGNSAFSGCSKLAKVNWSKVLTTIKDESFRNCGFTSLTLPETITVIDAGAFRSCASMTEVT